MPQLRNTPVFEDVQTVRFQHCDPAGIVFYPRYYEMLNLTVERFFEREVGYSFHGLHTKLGVTVPTVRMETDFGNVSKLEDLLQFQLNLVGLGRSSLTLTIDCFCKDQSRLQAVITLVCIDFKKKSATPWPEVLREKLTELQVVKD